MNVIVCVDDDMGMLFNRRRQSTDSALRYRILTMTAEGRLWMTPYSAKQFASEDAPQIQVVDIPLEKAGSTEYCFVETPPLKPYDKQIETLILYRWNRRYPSDKKLDIDWSKWKRIAVADFVGTSHEKITEERYIHK